MSALGEAISLLKRVFESHGLRWFVFGAQAVAARAAPRATQDVDVTVEVDSARLATVVVDLERRGFRHRYPEIAEELLAGGAVLPLVHEGGMEVDLVVAASGLEALALARATMVAVDGVEVPVAHPTDLVVMKTLAGRGKDEEDLRALLATGEVDLVEARDLLEQLERALGQSDLLPRLDAALRDVRG